jgi:hypothetical protein
LDAAYNALKKVRQVADTTPSWAANRKEAWSDAEKAIASKVMVELSRIHVAQSKLLPVVRSIVGTGDATAAATEAKSDLNSLQADIMSRAKAWPYAPAKLIGALKRAIEQVQDHFDEP